jgi:hypothetical protein
MIVILPKAAPNALIITSGSDYAGSQSMAFIFYVGTLTISEDSTTPFVG